MKKFVSLLKAALGVLPVAFVVGAAHANTVSTTGGVINFSWSYLATCTDPECVGPPAETQLITGNGTMTTSLVNGDDLSIAVTLNNTTVVPSGNNMALLSFGFGIDPNATGVTISGGTKMLDATLDSIPNTQQLIDVCAWGGQSCNGGPVGDGIQAGGSDAFTLVVAGAYGDEVTIHPIGFKFQGTIGSFEFFSSSSSSSSTSGSGITSGDTPEPGSAALALLGLGLLGAGYRLRHRAPNA
jgi:hypothetical protein